MGKLSFSFGRLDAPGFEYLSIMAPANEMSNATANEISIATANDTDTNMVTLLSSGNETLSTNSTLIPPIEEKFDILNGVVPLLIMALMISVAAIIYFVIRKRSAAQQRLQFVPMYTVEHDENEWESQLMDEELSKHTQIVKPNRGSDVMTRKKTGT